MSAPKQSELRIAVNPWPGYSFLFLAEELGYFQAEGIDVHLMEFDSLTDARRVFEAGNADVVGCSLVEVLLMNDVDASRSVEVFFACDYSAGGDMLVTHDNMVSVADLRGKRIGLEPDSLDGLCVYLALKAAGLVITDVTIVPLSQSEMRNAFLHGQVDALQVYPPLSDEITALPGVHTVWDSSDAPWAIVDVLATRHAHNDYRREDLRALSRAYFRAQQYFNEHRADAEVILARRCHISVEGLRKSLDRMQILDANPESQRSLLAGGKLLEAAQRTAEGLRAIGMLQDEPAQLPVVSNLHEKTLTRQGLEPTGS